MDIENIKTVSKVFLWEVTTVMMFQILSSIICTIRVESTNSHRPSGDTRVRKYAKFGVFYAKIVRMTPLRLRRESL